MHAEDDKAKEKTQQPGKIPANEITSDMIENAHAAGDGSVKRSDDAIAIDETQPPKGNKDSY